MKKMMTLAMAVMAVAAFAIPATASADKWAVNGTAIGAGVDITQNFEGTLEFNTGATGKFGCQVTATVTTAGPTAGTITKFAPTTGTCSGTVAFAGCKLIADKSNAPWNINLATTPLVVTKAGGVDVTIHNEYEPGSCAGGQTTSHLEFKDQAVKIDVEGTNPITKLTLTATATNSVVASGSLTREAPFNNLGIIN